MPRGVLTATAPAGGSMEADEGDDNVIPRSGRKMEVLQWNALSPAVLVKLLFLLDNGDVTSQHTDYSDNYHVSAPEEARDAFLSVLQDRQHSFTPVTEVLKDRVQHLMEYPFISLSARTMIANRCVRKNIEKLLTFVHVCRHLAVECRHMEERVKKVKNTLVIKKEEMEGNLFIYAENLRMLGLCDVLTARQVAQLLAVIEEDPTLWECVAADLQVSAATLDHTEGLKEVLFFYLIRTLELNNKLSRIYTNKLEALLEQLQNQTASEAERHVLSEVINRLGDYPGGGRPVGYCVVFCVVRGREGAQAEIKKVKHVFGRSLGYTVHIVENPDKDKLDECFKKLQKPQYRFHDSIVCWFMCHGSEDILQLVDGNTIERQTIIRRISNMENFRKKPRIFFFAACQGRSFIRIRQKGRGMIVMMDNHEGGHESFVVNPQHRYYLSDCHRKDRLVASATLPNHYSFRLPNAGSVYVDIVCRLMEQHRGHNITEVLERVTNSMHQIVFSSEEEFSGEAKQACCYESTLQKTFRVP